MPVPARAAFQVFVFRVNDSRMRHICLSKLVALRARVQLPAGCIANLAVEVTVGCSASSTAAVHDGPLDRGLFSVGQCRRHFAFQYFRFGFSPRI